MAHVTSSTTVTFDHREPSENPSPDWSAVVRMARAKFESDRDLADDPKDIKHYIYEGVMEAVYGAAFWPWSNERINFKCGD